MSEQKRLSRREALQAMVATAATAAAGLAVLRGIPARAGEIGAMLPGQGWLKQGAACDGDGTPLQFIPKTAPDPSPLTDELKKYPRCPYCGMKRDEWHHSRHLVHYDDDLVDPTCSLHCVALSLSLNLDRGVKAIHAADFGADGAIKPLIAVDQAVYLIGSKLKGTMSTTSKMAFAFADKAKAVQAEQGGRVGGFDEALRQTYADMAEDTIMIRKRRAERRRKMMEQKM